jgi:hypothetical protein
MRNSTVCLITDFNSYGALHLACIGTRIHCKLTEEKKIHFYCLETKTNVSQSHEHNVITICYVQYSELSLVFGLASSGRVVCWIYDERKSSISQELVHTFTGSDQSYLLSPSLGITITVDVPSCILITNVPDAFIHFLGLKIFFQEGRDFAHSRPNQNDPTIAGIDLTYRFDTVWGSSLLHSKQTSDGRQRDQTSSPINSGANICSTCIVPTESKKFGELRVFIAAETFLNVWRINIKLPCHSASPIVDSGEGSEVNRAFSGDYAECWSTRVTSNHKTWISAISQVCD